MISRIRFLSEGPAAPVFRVDKKNEEQAAVYTLSSLDQVRVLADPLRMKILEALCLAPRTTKQVAELISEKPTKLYHHVEALEKVGLIRLVETRPKRGTLEKYYQAVARSFRADSRLFSPEEGGGDEDWAATLDALFDRTRSDLQRLRELDRNSSDPPDEATLYQFKIIGDREGIENIRRKVDEIYRMVHEMGETPEDPVEYGLMIAFYPIVEDTD